MTVLQKQSLLDTAERVGVPTVILTLILYGMFMLVKPHLEAQTSVIGVMAMDIKETKMTVEADRQEHKAELLFELNTAIKKNHLDILEEVRDIKATLYHRHEPGHVYFDTLNEE